jgi:SEC-C motif domain protein
MATKQPSRRPVAKARPEPRKATLAKPSKSALPKKGAAKKAAAKPSAKSAAKAQAKPVVAPKKVPVAPVVQTKPVSAAPAPAVQPKPVAQKPVAPPPPPKPEDPSCPCKSGKLYTECCGPIHKKEREATTAEELMRSRYSAYVKSDVAHIMASSHPDLRKTLDEKATMSWAQNSEWKTFEIVSKERGTAADTDGIVEFRCEYAEKGVQKVLHERARFVKEENHWYYVDGEIVPPKPYVRETPKVGRNDPCPCGSGKKYKRCHGMEQ